MHYRDKLGARITRDLADLLGHPEEYYFNDEEFITLTFKEIRNVMRCEREVIRKIFRKYYAGKHKQK